MIFIFIAFPKLACMKGHFGQKDKGPHRRPSVEVLLWGVVRRKYRWEGSFKWGMFIEEENCEEDEAQSVDISIFKGCIKKGMIMKKRMIRNK